VSGLPSPLMSNKPIPLWYSANNFSGLKMLILRGLTRARLERGAILSSHTLCGAVAVAE